MQLTLNLVFIFASIGVLDTLYLIYHVIEGTDVACPFFPKEWCHKVQHSPQSRTFGVPNAVAGFIMYAAIIIFAYLYVLGAASFVLVDILVGIGFLFSLYFMFVQGFVLRAFCTWCVLSFVNFAVMAWAVFIR
ncbi:MAG: vitamin K epoxide reductase family protein [Patescibacteria group bacterium]|nr:vitamin K epoxide reductase family protein [Patescibacteria group bacterium]MDE2116611.1 vitamin K epoxide reductase family protein [Patescibacteria group bacterium]